MKYFVEWFNTAVDDLLIEQYKLNLKETAIIQEKVRSGVGIELSDVVNDPILHQVYLSTQDNLDSKTAIETVQNIYAQYELHIEDQDAERLYNHTAQEMGKYRALVKNEKQIRHLGSDLNKEYLNHKENSEGLSKNFHDTVMKQADLIIETEAIMVEVNPEIEAYFKLMVKENKARYQKWLFVLDTHFDELNNYFNASEDFDFIKKFSQDSRLLKIVASEENLSESNTKELISTLFGVEIENIDGGDAQKFLKQAKNEMKKYIAIVKAKYKFEQSLNGLEKYKLDPELHFDKLEIYRRNLDNVLDEVSALTASIDEDIFDDLASYIDTAKEFDSTIERPYSESDEHTDTESSATESTGYSTDESENSFSQDSEAASPRPEWTEKDTPTPNSDHDKRKGEEVSDEATVSKLK